MKLHVEIIIAKANPQKTFVQNREQQQQQQIYLSCNKIIFR